jgi:hypothetical protein
MRTPSELKELGKNLADYVYENIIDCATEFSKGQLDDSDCSVRFNFLKRLESWIREDYNYFIEYNDIEELTDEEEQFLKKYALSYLDSSIDEDNKDINIVEIDRVIISDNNF